MISPDLPRQIAKAFAQGLTGLAGRSADWRRLVGQGTGMMAGKKVQRGLRLPAAEAAWPSAWAWARWGSACCATCR
jgi:hypothetical protein